MTGKIRRSDEQWRQLLSDEQYRVTRAQGTERAFSGEYWDCHDAGTYACVCCGAPLFASDDKYDSGSGWPSFTRPLAPAGVATHEDRSHGMQRTEVVCAACDAHLGHVFADGPAPTGRRYCINSAALQLHRQQPGDDDAGDSTDASTDFSVKGAPGEK